MEALFFYIFAAIIVVFSTMTVSASNILRAAVYLLFVLGATSGLYFMMNFNFLAAVQLTVYSGGIVVLIIFSILLTHQINTKLDPSKLRKRLMAGGISLAAGLVFIWTLFTFNFKISDKNIEDTSVTNIGMQLMNYGENGYALPFEVISVLLLACMIAAIIIAKKFTDD